MNQQEMARWLKVILAVAGLIGLALCFLVLPLLGKELAAQAPELSALYYPCLIYLWAAGVPVFAALGIGWKICSAIAADQSFCRQNARRLSRISKLAFVEFLFWVAGAALLLCLNLLHPSILLMGLLIAFLCIAASVAAAALSHLVEKAAALDEDNQLTI